MSISFASFADDALANPTLVREPVDLSSFARSLKRELLQPVRQILIPDSALLGSPVIREALNESSFRSLVQEEHITTARRAPGRTLVDVADEQAEKNAYGSTDRNREIAAIFDDLIPSHRGPVSNYEHNQRRLDEEFRALFGDPRVARGYGLTDHTAKIVNQDLIHTEVPLWNRTLVVRAILRQASRLHATQKSQALLAAIVVWQRVLIDDIGADIEWAPPLRRIALGPYRQDLAAYEPELALDPTTAIQARLLVGARLDTLSFAQLIAIRRHRDFEAFASHNDRGSPEMWRDYWSFLASMIGYASIGREADIVKDADLSRKITLSRGFARSLRVVVLGSTSIGGWLTMAGAFLAVATLSENRYGKELDEHRNRGLQIFSNLRD